MGSVIPDPVLEEESGDTAGPPSAPREGDRLEPDPVEPGEVVSGYPAIPNRLWLRCSAAFSKLPEMAKQIRELKKAAQ